MKVIGYRATFVTYRNEDFFNAGTTYIGIKYEERSSNKIPDTDIESLILEWICTTSECDSNNIKLPSHEEIDNIEINDTSITIIEGESLLPRSERCNVRFTHSIVKIEEIYDEAWSFLEPKTGIIYSSGYDTLGKKHINKDFSNILHSIITKINDEKYMKKKYEEYKSFMENKYLKFV